MKRCLMLCMVVLLPTTAAAQANDPMAFTLRRVLYACEGKTAEGRRASNGAEDAMNRVGCATWLAGFVAASVQHRVDLLTPCVEDAISRPSLAVGRFLEGLRGYAALFPQDLDVNAALSASALWNTMCPVP